MADRSSDPAFTQTHAVSDPATVPRTRRGGRLGWHVHKPTQGPASLAVKNHFIAMIGEFTGTTLFMIFALGGTNVANIPTTSVTGAITEGQSGTAAAVANTSNLLYIALSFGFSLAVNAWIFFRVSGGLFNPAVSLGMLLVGALTPLRAALLTVSQILGGITGAAIIQALLPGTLNVRTTLSADTSVVRGLFIEMFLTTMLMITILLLAAEKHKATFLAPIGIGLALFIAELLGVFYTGGSLNPARSFGPAVVLRTFSSYHWIYWVGPFLGAIVAAGFYKLLKWLQYETNLGPEEEAAQAAQANQAGQLVAPSMTMIPTSSAAATAGPSAGGRLPPISEKPSAPSRQPSGMDVQGPGIGDLLTASDNNAGGGVDMVYGLPQQQTFELPVEYNNRMERIEAMLAQLVAQREVNQYRQVAGDAPRSERYSVEGTVVEDPQGHVWKRDSPV